MSQLKNLDKDVNLPQRNAHNLHDTVDYDLSGPELTVEAFGATDRGQLRESNEDQFVIAELAKLMRVEQTSLPEPAEQAAHTRGHLFLVADGMGGYAGGEEASRIAVRTVEECLLDSLKWFLRTRGEEGDEVIERLQAALGEADARIISEATRRPHLHGMGTTLTLAFFLGRELFVVHAGDSRAYLCRNARLYRLTRDHTLLAEMTRAGKLLPGQEHSERLRHTVTNVVGGPRAGVKADVVRAPVDAGDRLLLCTDGLTDTMSDEEIARVLTEWPGPEEACRRLIDQANARGGPDNITTVVVAFRTASRH